MGNTCKPMAVSFQCMTKSTTIKKKKDSSCQVLKNLLLLFGVELKLYINLCNIDIEMVFCFSMSGACHYYFI